MSNVTYNGKRTNKDMYTEKLEKELKFVKSQMARVLSLYDEAKQEAEMAKKSRGEFISRLSHEFRTPMNALMGYSDILSSKAVNEEIKYYTGGIKSATNRLLNLVNDIIEVTRIESGITVCDKEEYDSVVLFNSVLDGLYDSVNEKGLLLNLKVHEDIPSRLYGDFYHLRQIICNILDNAVKYTEKGYISLEIEAKKGVEINSNGRKSLQLIFHIKDTGIGIRKSDQDKLFMSFAQFDSKNPYANQGIGVGLTVAKYFSNQMHGDITFESKHGEGSTFTCTVMQEIVDETPIGPNHNVGSDVQRQIVFKAPEAEVLIVDDSVVNLNVGKGILSGYDIVADTAEGGYQALKYVEKKKYDLIFMDHMMPDIDGIETMKCIRNKGGWCEHVPIVALTANVTDEARTLFKMEGMQDFLAKPIELGLLRDVLVKWLPKAKMEFGDLCDVYNTKSHDNIVNGNTAFNAKRLAMDGIDLETGLTYFGGNIEAYKSTACDIFKDCSKKHKLICDYYEKRDLEKFAIEAHSMKSIAASIGATTFSKQAKEMELKAKSGDIHYIEENGRAFLNEYSQFVEKMGKLLQEEAEFRSKDSDLSGKTDDITKEDEPLTNEDIFKILNEANTLLCDYEADKACEKIKKLIGQKDRVDMIEKVYIVLEKIDDFEYEEAQKMIKEIESSIKK